MCGESKIRMEGIKQVSEVGLIEKIRGLRDMRELIRWIFEGRTV